MIEQQSHSVGLTRLKTRRQVAGGPDPGSFPAFSWRRILASHRAIWTIEQTLSGEIMGTNILLGPRGTQPFEARFWHLADINAASENVCFRR
jgi:hypothetical protein